MLNRDRNFEVTVDSKSVEVKGNLKVNIKGLKATSKGSHRFDENDKPMGHSSNISVDSLSATLTAKGGAKGLVHLAAKIAENTKRAELGLGNSENVFSGCDDIACTIQASGVFYSEDGVKSRHAIINKNDDKVSHRHENIDTYDNVVTIDEIELEGNLSDVADVVLTVLADMRDEAAPKTHEASKAE